MIQTHWNKNAVNEYKSISFGWREYGVPCKSALAQGQLFLNELKWNEWNEVQAMKVLTGYRNLQKFKCRWGLSEILGGLQPPTSSPGSAIPGGSWGKYRTVESQK